MNSTPVYRGHLFLSTYSLYLSLDAFMRLRKDTTSFVGFVYLYILLSVRLEKVGSNWTNSHEFRYLETCRKYFEKFKNGLKPEKNSEYLLHKGVGAFMI